MSSPMALSDIRSSRAVFLQQTNSRWKPSRKDDVPNTAVNGWDGASLAESEQWGGSVVRRDVSTSLIVATSCVVVG